MKCSYRVINKDYKNYMRCVTQALRLVLTPAFTRKFLKTV